MGMGTILIALMVLLAPAAEAWAQQPVTFMTGNSLLERCRPNDYSYYNFDIVYCRGYITGVFDQLQYNRWFAGLDPCPKVYYGINETQVWDVVVNFLIANPTSRTRAADELVVLAIGNAWGCSTAPTKSSVPSPGLIPPDTLLPMRRR